MPAARITCVAKTSCGRNHRNTLVPTWPCFVHLQVYDDDVEQIVAGESYTLRGRQRGKVYSGTTDESGILRHEAIPDDYYDLEIQGKKEPVEVWYMSEMDLHGGEPWVLRIRKV